MRNKSVILSIGIILIHHIRAYIESKLKKCIIFMVINYKSFIGYFLFKLEKFIEYFCV